MAVYFKLYLLCNIFYFVNSEKYELPEVSSVSSELEDHVNYKYNGTNVLILLVNDCEDIEAVTLLSVLRKGNVNTQLAGITDTIEPVKLQFDLLVYPDADMEMVKDEGPYDMIILPGGKGYQNYINSRKISRLIKRQFEAGRYIVALSTAPIFLYHLKLGLNKHITFAPAWNSLMGGFHVHQECGVVQDGNLITCKGPSSAMELGLHIVGIFKGEMRVAQVTGQLSYKRNLSDVLVVNSYSSDRYSKIV